LLECDDTFVN